MEKLFPLRGIEPGIALMTSAFEVVDQTIQLGI